MGKGKKVRKAFLVYQASVANVFAVDCLNLKSFGREARRLIQGSFATCVAFAQGLGAAGVVVRTAACNKAGDVAMMDWTEEFSCCLADIHLN